MNYMNQGMGLPQSAQPMIDWANMNNWGNTGAAMPAAAGLPPITEMSAMPGMSGVAGAAAPGFMDKMLGYRGADGTQFNGWGGMALGAASGLMNGYVGLQQLGLYKDQLAQSKKQFDINFGAQQKLTNSRLEDRQRARVASNSSTYQSVGDYMNQNRI